MPTLVAPSPGLYAMIGAPGGELYGLGGVTYTLLLAGEIEAAHYWFTDKAPAGGARGARRGPSENTP